MSRSQIYEKSKFMKSTDTCMSKSKLMSDKRSQMSRSSVIIPRNYVNLWQSKRETEGTQRHLIGG